MIDPTVTDFFTKNAESDYLNEYDRSHGPRLDDLVSRLKELNFFPQTDQKILDVGGGLGFLGRRLHPSNDYWVVDGAEVAPEQRLCPGHWIKADLDHDAWGRAPWATGNQFDVTFCLETIEHIGNPHFAIEQIKAATKIGGTVIISIPTETVWHNCPYPGLLWPGKSFALFLRQMALHTKWFFMYEPKTVGWPAYTFITENRPWREKELLYPKAESKFLDATPLQCTNL